MEAKHTPGPSEIMAIEIERQYADWKQESQQGYTASLDTKLRVITALIERHTSVGRNSLEAEKAELTEELKECIRGWDSFQDLRPLTVWERERLDSAKAALAKAQPPRMNATIQADPTDPDFECSMSPGCPCDDCQKENVKMD